MHVYVCGEEGLLQGLTESLHGNMQSRYVEAQTNWFTKPPHSSFHLFTHSNTRPFIHAWTTNTHVQAGSLVPTPSSWLPPNKEWPLPPPPSLETLSSGICINVASLQLINNAIGHLSHISKAPLSSRHVGFGSGTHVLYTEVCPAHTGAC